tara:strand:- start:1131 stop:1703 length:573 start_codon:yes stop_codon:yes gene_type:complete
MYIMSTKIKKLTLQYAYLKLEKEEVDEVCLMVEEEMRTYLEKHFPEYCEAFYEPPGKPQEKSKTEKETIEEPPPTPPKNKDLKKLYRKIAEKTHPDRVGNNSHADLFSQAASAYANNDIAKLLDIASGINIELSELSSDSILLLKNNIKTVFEEINTKKKTAAWAWHKSVGEEEKKVIIENILFHRGILI